MPHNPLGVRGRPGPLTPSGALDSYAVVARPIAFHSVRG